MHSSSQLRSNLLYASPRLRILFIPPHFLDERARPMPEPAVPFLPSYSQERRRASFRRAALSAQHCSMRGPTHI